MAGAEASASPFAGARIADLAELNARLADNARSSDSTAALAGDFWFDMPIDPSIDPLSTAYRAIVLAHYRDVAGPGSPAPPGTGPDPMHAISYPYNTGDGQQVGRWLQTIGFIIATCRVRRGHRVLTIGSDAGLPVTLAQTGCTVTALGADRDAADHLLARADQAGVRLRVLQAGLADALAALGGRRFDVVMFYAAFHRSEDHVALLHLIRDHILAAGGRVVLAGEPLLEALPAAWSLNPAGAAIQAMRRGGGPSLLFRPSYLLEALSACGYGAELLQSQQSGLADLIIARRLAT